MGKLIKDLHVSELRYVGESNNPPTNVSKYKRYSIPYMPNRHCLGYIEGPAASLTEDTRNGRGYVLKLWQNVEQSAEFQEGMKCATIVGELDHPEERIDYSLANGAVILTDWEIREDEGIVWARFAILDNQRGKDLLAYVKFGTVLGVSSRGLGDEIIQNGRSIIDPDTYEFYCFDVVAFPAAECARQTFVSADSLKEAKSVHEAFADRVLIEASRCSTKEQLVDLQNVVESTSVADKAKLVEAITDKISSLPESAGNESTLGEGEEEYEKQILLSNHLKEVEAKDSIIEQLKDKLKKCRENSNYFRRTVQEQRSEIADLEEAISSGLESTDSISKEYAELKTKHESLERNYNLALEKHRVAESQFKSNLESYANKARKAAFESKDLKDTANKLISVKESLTSQNEALTQEVNMLRKQLTHTENKLSVSEASRSKMVENIQKLEFDNAKYAAESKKAVNEAASETSRLRSKIASLQTELTAVTEARTTAEAEVSELHESVRNSKKEFQKMESYAKRMVIEYAKKSAYASGIQYEAIRQLLPENFTKSDVDKVVETLSERQHKFDSLPISMTPISTRIVEHKSRDNATESSSLVFRALSQDSI